MCKLCDIQSPKNDILTNLYKRFDLELLDQKSVDCLSHEPHIEIVLRKREKQE